jgi:hypothetical protein
MPALAKFKPALHPRDRKGKFTRSRSAAATTAERQRAAKVAEAFRPKQIPAAGRSDYLHGIAPTEHAETVSLYLDGADYYVNQSLRSGKADPAVDRVDAALVELPDDIVVSRRVPASVFGTGDPELLTGLKVTDAAYTPTTLGTLRPTRGDVRMHIAVPAGTRALIDPDSGQVVLDRGLEMVVAKIEPNGAGGHDMYVTVLGGTTSPDRFDRDFEKAARNQGALDAAPVSMSGGWLDGGPLSSAALSGADGKLSPAQRAASAKALVAYQGAVYSTINRYMRRGTEPDPVLDATIADIRKALQASPLDHDVIVYRGLRNPRRTFGRAWNNTDVTGLEFEDKALSSTSADERVAVGFSGGGANPTVLRILQRKGTPAVRLSGMAEPGKALSTATEAELLFGPQRLRIVTDHGSDDRGVRIVDAEVIA